jgi:hypothetical protein
MGDMTDVEAVLLKPKPPALTVAPSTPPAAPAAAASTGKPDRMPQSELFQRIAIVMDGKRSGKWPKFKRRFYVMHDEAQRKSYLEEIAPGVVRHVTVDVIADAIFCYCMRELTKVPEAQISPRQADLARQAWAALAAPLELRPLPLVEKSSASLAFARLPVDLDVDITKDMPEVPHAFASFLDRCSQPEEVCAFIGSLFFPEADRQQYLYLHGPGLDGKGSFLRFLFELMPEACQFLQPRGRDDRFWNAKLLGKRVVIFADCEQPTYFSSPEFKSLTGDDPIYVEEKGHMGFSMKPTCKFIVASNYAPTITGQNSDMRRIIYCQIKPVIPKYVEPRFEKVLLAETHGILRMCKWMYLYLTKAKHGPIPCELPRGLADDGEEEYLAAFDESFEVAPGESVPASTVRRLLRNKGYKQNKDVARIKECWERRLGVVARRTSGGGERVYWGCKLRGLEGLHAH